ncbi:MAG: hypothetical protein ABGX05_19180 [Pirellulaceae bacterium]
MTSISLEESMADSRLSATGLVWFTVCWLARTLGSWWDWCFGLVSLVVVLAILATIPIVQLLTLGYLLESGARVASTGRLRDGFIGIRQVSRLGSVALGTWLLLWPVRYVADIWYSSYLIAPGSRETTGWRIFLLALLAFSLAQVAWACFRGGRLRHFFWLAPLRLKREIFLRGKYVRCRDAVWDFVSAMRLGYYFVRGWQGFLGAAIWLLVPILLFIGATVFPFPLGLLSGITGAVLLMFVFPKLPFLQLQGAVEGNVAAMFDTKYIRELSGRAPLMFCLALTVTLTFALPLYLLKIELTPREVFVLPSLVFVLFSFPARLLTGWALSRAYRHPRRRHFVFRWMSRMLAVSVVATYVLFIFFTRYTSWHGHWSLLEQHAFIVPVPF